MDKKELIETGNFLINSIKKRNRGLEIIEDFMDDEYLQLLDEWTLCANEFVELNGLDCHKQIFEENNWVRSGSRVSKERIEKILSLIERIKN